VCMPLLRSVRTAYPRFAKIDVLQWNYLCHIQPGTIMRTLSIREMRNELGRLDQLISTEAKF